MGSDNELVEFESETAAQIGRLIAAYDGARARAEALDSKERAASQQADRAAEELGRSIYARYAGYGDRMAVVTEDGGRVIIANRYRGGGKLQFDSYVVPLTGDLRDTHGRRDATEGGQ
ncbi:MAG: hypothetical protein KKD53_00830 [Proteobacteria bacterium]|nr:hypothetical protein [Pseudomonadota bacterium]